MKIKTTAWAAHRMVVVSTMALAAFQTSDPAAAAIGTDFTYQGQLKRGAVPVNDTCNFRFGLFKTLAGPDPAGSPLALGGVPVTDGLFAVELDFGAAAFPGDPRFLEISVQCTGDAAPIMMAPRQTLTATPYASTALQTVGIDGYSLDASDGSPTNALVVDSTGKVRMEKGGLTVFDDGGQGINLTTDRFSFNEGTSEDPVWSYSSADDTHTFYANGDRKLVINAAGDVGIGLNSPSAKLHIGGVAGVDGIMFPDGTLQKTAGGGGPGSSPWSVDPSDNVYYGDGFVGIGFGTSDLPPLQMLHVNGDSYLNGDVGIGTSTPRGRLHISGPNDPLDGPILTLAGDLADRFEGGRIRFDESPTNLRGGFVHYNALANKLHFGVHQLANMDPADDVNLITLWRNNGAVGIGMESPAYPLHIGAETRIDAKVGIGAPSSTDATLKLVTDSIYGIKAETPNAIGAAVLGEASDDAGFAYGLYGLTSGRGAGVIGSGAETGIEGVCNYAGGVGVYGHNSTGGTGVFGEVTSGVNYGVRGESASTSGYGGYFTNTSSDGTALYARSAGAGTSDATLRVHNTQVNAGMAAYMTSVGTYATMHAKNDGTGEVLWLSKDAAEGEFIVAHNERTGRRVFSVDHDGWTKVAVLEIVGGADLSEQFDVDSKDAEVKPGAVVSIDEKSPGKLRLADQPYDRKVAGVVSGAGGVKPGMLMGQKGTMADGKHPIALTGRVWTWCDATAGAIEPGDMLTTSGTPGHAMKVADHDKAQGAVIGKAMSPLNEGKGLVLILVSLQ